MILAQRKVKLKSKEYLINVFRDYNNVILWEAFYKNKEMSCTTKAEEKTFPKTLGRKGQELVQLVTISL